MQKQQIIGISLITLILVLYIGVILPKYQPAPVKQAPKTTVAKDTTASSTVSSTTTQVEISSTTVLDTTILQNVQEITVDSDLYRAKFTTLGGRLTSFRLKGIAVEKFLKPADLEKQYAEATIRQDESTAELVHAEIAKLKQQDELRKKEKEARDRKDETAAKEFADMAAELDWVELVTENHALELPFELDFSTLPKADKLTLYSPSTTHITLNKEHPSDTLVLTGKLNNGLVVEKNISFRNDTYILPFNLKLTNSSEKQILLSDNGVGLKIHTGAGIGELQIHAQSRYNIGVQAVAKVNNKVQVISVTPKNPNYRLSGDITWGAIETNYFFKGFVPQVSLVTTIVAQNTPVGKTFTPNLWLEVPTLDLPVKYESKQSFLFYIGPKKLEYLAGLKVPAEEILFYHPWFGFLKTIDLWLLQLMKLCFALIHNYGVAVIIISVLLKVVTFPLTHISFKSMKAMQALAPEMKALQEKYKDDPTRIQKETMELYRKHKVNPMSGCLPLLIQMPIFISLYSVLGKAIELRGAPFVGWITDLSKPDTVGYIFGIPINILPLLMGATMWLQQKMSTTPDPKSAMMSQMMTIVFLFMFWGMPSGLVLYWFVTNILSILQQHYINKQTIPVHLPHHVEGGK